MGLDMYLVKEKEDGKLDYTNELAYWRKANHIHSWFVKNVQNNTDECIAHQVSEEQLEELLRVCKEVLKDHSKADELLPTQNGFFFGSTQYDEYYFGAIEETIETIGGILDNFDFKNEKLYYDSSW